MEKTISRRRRSLCAASVGAALLGILGACAKPPQIAPGQVWSYKTRRGEGASTIQILHIENGTPLGEVMFISVRGLTERRGRKWWATEIWPLVFTRDAVKRSLAGYQWSEPVKRAFQRELNVWNKDAREGRAAERTFTVTVGEALDEIEMEHPGTARKRFAEA